MKGIHYMSLYTYRYLCRYLQILDQWKELQALWHITFIGRRANWNNMTCHHPAHTHSILIVEVLMQTSGTLQWFVKMPDFLLAVHFGSQLRDCSWFPSRPEIFKPEIPSWRLTTRRCRENDRERPQRRLFRFVFCSSRWGLFAGFSRRPRGTNVLDQPDFYCQHANPHKTCNPILHRERAAFMYAVLPSFCFLDMSIEKQVSAADQSSHWVSRM